MQLFLVAQRKKKKNRDSGVSSARFTWCFEQIFGPNSKRGKAPAQHIRTPSPAVFTYPIKVKSAVKVSNWKNLYLFCSTFDNMCTCTIQFNRGYEATS